MPATARRPRKAGIPEPPPVKRHVQAGGLSNYVELYRSAPTERVQLIREGFSAVLLQRTINELGLTQAQTLRMLNFPRSTIRRKLRRNEMLTTEQSERFLGLLRLIGQVEFMINEVGDPRDFDVAKWVAHWLEQPSPALGGKVPAEFMDTIQGQVLISNLVAKMQSGAYA